MTCDPMIAFPDAAWAVRDALRELAPALTVSTRDIPGDDGKPWPIPYIQVRSDGVYRDAMLNGRANIRVLCYGRDDGDCLRLAHALEAALLSEVSTDRIRGCNPLTGPYLATDADNGLRFAYFTVTARLRPREITREELA